MSGTITPLLLHQTPVGSKLVNWINWFIVSKVTSTEITRTKMKSLNTKHTWNCYLFRKKMYYTGPISKSMLRLGLKADKEAERRNPSSLFYPLHLIPSSAWLPSLFWGKGWFCLCRTQGCTSGFEDWKNGWLGQTKCLPFKSSAAYGCIPSRR